MGQILKCIPGWLQTRIEQVCKDNYKENNIVPVNGQIKDIYLLCRRDQIRNCIPGGLQTRIGQVCKENSQGNCDIPVSGQIHEIRIEHVGEEIKEIDPV